ncbi:hypothetical protein BDV93DRAFT_581900 [Ceratobasidium sp. AG-I]|nr:hypothetical protein BDV93DRAFT_581900 [Ceratobasidium sp. AG-I]
MYKQKEFNFTRMENITVKYESCRHWKGVLGAWRASRLLDMLNSPHLSFESTRSAHSRSRPIRHTHRFHPAAAVRDGPDRRLITGPEDDKLNYSWKVQGQISFDGNWRRYWVFFLGMGNGAQYLATTEPFAYMDTSGTDPSGWSLRCLYKKYMLVMEGTIFRAQNTQVQASIAYLNRHYGVGEEARQLLSRFDWLYGVLVLNATSHTEDEYYVSPDTICIFEARGFSMTTERLVWEYKEKVHSQYRKMATVYDYNRMFNYLSYPERTVEARMAASGYPQATYWDAPQDNYGIRIQRATMGSVLSHVINYKS